MSLKSRQERVHEEILEAQIVNKTTGCTLEPYELLVYIDTSGSASAVTIKMANVAAMKGKFVTLFVLAFLGAITIAAADSVDFASVVPTLDGASDGAVLYSDGIHWWVLGTART